MQVHGILQKMVYYQKVVYPFITFWLECVATTLKSHVKRSSGYAFEPKSDITRKWYITVVIYHFLDFEESDFMKCILIIKILCASNEIILSENVEPLLESIYLKGECTLDKSS